MFNSTDRVIYLLEGEELYKAIIDSIDKSREVIKDYLGIDFISPSDVTSSSRNPLRRGTIFKFLDGHRHKSNAVLFNKDWVESVFDYSNKADSSNDHIARRIFTTEKKSEKLTNEYRGSLKKDSILLLHLLWCNRAIILPFDVSLPYGVDPQATEKNSGSHFEYAASTYPEVLAIAKQPFLTHVEYNVPRIENEIPLRARKNFDWYFRRFVRSCTWWRVEDISTDDIKSILSSNIANSPNRAQLIRLRGWLGYFLRVIPDRCKFDLVKTLEHGAGQGVYSNMSSEDKNAVVDSFIPDEIQPQIKEWVKYLDLWEKKLTERGTISSRKKRISANKLISYFVSEIYPKSGNDDVPYPRNFTRKYLDGWNPNIPSLLEYIKNGRINTTQQQNLYDINQFFDFLEKYHDENGFKNTFDQAIDTPLVRRRNKTIKEIFPNEYFPPLVSFLYGLCDWVWFMIELASNDYGQQHLHSLEIENAEKRYWDTQKTGFVPIFWIDGKPIPILAIPYGLAPISYRSFKGKGIQRCYRIIDPHYIHLATLIYETGIRGTHARWLDIRNYDQKIDRSCFNPYSYDVCELYVNTDKVNGAWYCLTSQPVIGILDRQKYYQNMIDGEGADTLLNYSNIEHSPYEKIQCLFFKGLSFSSNLTVAPIGGSGLGEAFKKILYAFNVILHKETDLNLFIDISTSNTTNNENEYFCDVFSKNSIDSIDTKITPHSARSQVVSAYITLLPPSIIKLITGHATDAHVIYYAQLDKAYLESAQKDSADFIFGTGSLGEAKLSNIKAEDVNSRLRQAMMKNKIGAMEDFGATSFSSQLKIQGVEKIANGLIELKKASAEHLAFNSTHICPFNNQCPTDIVRDLKATDRSRPCGSCYYAVKTVDHIPRISGKIRALTDECAELEKFIKEGKNNGVAKDTISDASNRRRFLADEIMGWSVTIKCLEKMANDLRHKDQWLVDKPELLSEHIQKITAPDGQLENMLLRIEEAKTHAEYFTPALKYQLKAARTKLLAFTGQFQALLADAPDDYSLLDEFRGQIKSICDVANISVSDLSKRLETPVNTLESSNQPLALMSSVKGDSKNA